MSEFTLVGQLAQIAEQEKSVIICFNKGKGIIGYTVSLPPKKILFKESDIVSLIIQDEAEAIEDYDDKVERRRDSLKYKAGAIEDKARSQIASAKERLGRTHGQPIHLDGTNPDGDIGFRNKIERDFIKGYGKLKEVRAVQYQADRVGTGGVSSDDPQAIEKLILKIEGHQTRLVLMKATNKVVKSKKFKPEQKVQKLVELGHTSEGATKLLKPSLQARDGGYPAFQYPTDTIRDTKKRIASLIIAKCEKLASEDCEPIKTRHDDLALCVVENHAINRLQIVFDNTPDSKAAWGIMKKRGFNFSHGEGAYQRNLGNARWATGGVLSDLRDAKECLVNKSG
jgi:hypothetical protein